MRFTVYLTAAIQPSTRLTVVSRPRALNHLPPGGMISLYSPLHPVKLADPRLSLFIFMQLLLEMFYFILFVHDGLARPDSSPVAIAPTPRAWLRVRQAAR